LVVQIVFCCSFVKIMQDWNVFENYFSSKLRILLVFHPSSSTLHHKLYSYLSSVLCFPSSVKWMALIIFGRFRLNYWNSRISCPESGLLVMLLRYLLYCYFSRGIWEQQLVSSHRKPSWGKIKTSFSLWFRKKYIRSFIKREFMWLSRMYLAFYLVSFNINEIIILFIILHHEPLERVETI